MLYTVGRPRPGVELEVRDADDRAVPAGEVGEVCMLSPGNMAGYWRDPEATARTLRGGWLHTGDEGAIDERGCLRLVGRRGDAYSRGGYNVYPKEIEDVLGWHPKVAQVAIVPRPDEVMGSVGVAVVVPANPHQPPALHELREFGAAHLAKFKLPEAIRIVDAMPMTAMLKIDRRGLIAVEAESAS
jgi:acyl-CoA synthetase (AMP-forming)/AMP-acid ligase II